MTFEKAMTLPPEYMYRGTTKRKWKSKKRQQLIKVRKLILDEFAWGGAGSPAWVHMERALELIDKGIEAQSVEKWGR